MSCRPTLPVDVAPEELEGDAAARLDREVARVRLVEDAGRAGQSVTPFG